MLAVYSHLYLTILCSATFASNICTKKSSVSTLFSRLLLLNLIMMLLLSLNEINILVRNDLMMCVFDNSETEMALAQYVGHRNQCFVLKLCRIYSAKGKAATSSV